MKTRDYEPAGLRDKPNLVVSKSKIESTIQQFNK